MYVTKEKENPVDLKGFLEELEVELKDGRIFWRADFEKVLSEAYLNSHKMVDKVPGVCNVCEIPRDQFGCACKGSVYFLKGDYVPVEIWVEAWSGENGLERHNFKSILGEENGDLIYQGNDRFSFKSIYKAKVVLLNNKAKA